jgi:hypothetical protein
MEDWEQYQLKNLNRFAALDNLYDGWDINRTWENIRQNIKISAKYSLGQHKQKLHNPRCDE